MLLVILVCITSPYWGNLSFGNNSSQCQCPWCMAEKYAVDNEYEIVYNYTSDGMSITVRPQQDDIPVIDSIPEDENQVNDYYEDQWDVQAEDIEPEVKHNEEGYYVLNENGQDIVLYTDGNGTYWYVDSNDGYPVVTDNIYEGKVPGETVSDTVEGTVDESFGGYGGEMPVVGEDGNTYYVQW